MRQFWKWMREPAGPFAYILLISVIAGLVAQIAFG
jgi:hypothetical protein